MVTTDVTVPFQFLQCYQIFLLVFIANIVNHIMGLLLYCFKKQAKIPAVLITLVLLLFVFTKV